MPLTVTLFGRPNNVTLLAELPVSMLINFGVFTNVPYNLQYTYCGWANCSVLKNPYGPPFMYYGEGGEQVAASAIKHKRTKRREFEIVDPDISLQKSTAKGCVNSTISFLHFIVPPLMNKSC